MRPKIVLFTFLIAFGVLGIVVLLKSTAGKKTVEPVGQQSSQSPAAAQASTSSNAMASGETAGSNNAPVVSPELREALIENERDQIRELLGQIDGSNNVTIVSTLLEKMKNPETEVRKAALEGLVQLNDTNAVPGLQKTAEGITDPREKVAIMDAIEYLKMPSITQNVPSENLTNAAVANVPFNPALVRAKKDRQQNAPAR